MFLLKILPKDFTTILLKKPDAIFISIPVNPGPKGQDQDNLILAAEYAKEITPHVFVRSTVLPGTNDRLKTYSMPEFLTARRAYEDFIKLPLVFGDAPHDLIQSIFKNKIQVDKNTYIFQTSRPKPRNIRTTSMARPRSCILIS